LYRLKSNQSAGGLDAGAATENIPRASVAVGTALSGGPPHRSVQAHFSAHGSYLG
jgi:hypothetical protein